MDSTLTKIKIESKEMEIKGYEAQIWAEKQNQKVLNELLERCKRHKNKIERNLDNTAQSIKKRVVDLNDYGKFQKTYIRQTNNALKGSSANQAVEIVNDIIKSLNRKLQDSFDDIERYQRKINVIEQEKYTLEQELNRLEI